MFELDIHTHLIPAASLADIAGVSWDSAARTLLIDKRRISISALFDPVELIRWMDSNAIGRAWVSPPPPAFRPDLDDAAAKQWCDALNKGLIALTRPYRDRLAPMLFLPVEHPHIACQMVEKAGSGRLFAMSTGSHALKLSDERYVPLWDALDSRGAFLFLHPGESCDPRLDAYYLANLTGNPSETGIAVGHLVFAGVADTWKRITFVLSHAGGTVPSIAGRWQRGVDTERPGVNPHLSVPGVLTNSFLCDCIAHSSTALRAARETFGQSALVFGSDWPFPMGLIDPATQLQAIAPDALGAICENSARLASCTAEEGAA